jgi:hypothetical protein
MIKTLGPPWVRRTILALISFLIAMLGAATLFHGKLEYYNWWGGSCCAPSLSRVTDRFASWFFPLGN